MRPSRKLFATVTTASARHAERYLTAGTPTGLTGLRTHPCPRSALIYFYKTTLQKLEALPKSSGYREATQALTKHRLAIVEGIEPAGYAAWAERARKLLEENKATFGAEVFKYGNYAPEAFEARRFMREGFKKNLHIEDREMSWDGLPTDEPLEGIRTQEERDMAARRDRVREQSQIFEGSGVEWEDSPPLEASQVQEIEDKIASGLIEEVVQVAQGESQLVDQMAKSKVWEELVEKPAEGQWQYFGRAQHMPRGGSQAPPKND